MWKNVCATHEMMMSCCRNERVQCTANVKRMCHKGMSNHPFFRSLVNSTLWMRAIIRFRRDNTLTSRVYVCVCVWVRVGRLYSLWWQVYHFTLTKQIWYTSMRLMSLELMSRIHALFNVHAEFCSSDANDVCITIIRLWKLLLATHEPMCDIE